MWGLRRRVCYMRSHGGPGIVQSAVPCTGVFEAWGCAWDSLVGACAGGGPQSGWPGALVHFSQHCFGREGVHSRVGRA
eukprot:3469544-Alexandrium_andersonii.AAC.1